MACIAIGGFQHETNTFASTTAAFADFEMHDAWPGLTRGPAMFDAVSGLNLAVEGFIEAARADGHVLVPLLWCSAEPSSCVTEDAFERITGMLVEDLQRLGPFDAVFLDLHGAMVVDHHQDGEGETLERVRNVVGPGVPVVNTLDLHANITERMVALSSGMTIYRTYPHIDMDVTGARCYRLLSRLLAGETLHKGFARAPFLVPLPAQWTDAEPNRRFYDLIADQERAGVASSDLALAFPPADIAECGPAAIAYDPDAARAQAAAGRIKEVFVAAEGDAEAGHDLVEDPQDAMPRAQVAHALQKALLRGHEAHVAGHGLEDDGGHLPGADAVDGAPQQVEVVELEELEPREPHRSDEPTPTI